VADGRRSARAPRRLAHLARRFFTSLRPRPPAPTDLEWVRSALSPAEWDVWRRLGTADRVEAIATARRLPARYAADARWVAAALLHDAGKAEAGLGTFRRAVATVIGFGRDAEKVGGRSGVYLRHPQIGAELLARTGARPEAVAWAAMHHHPKRWATGTIPHEVCEALARADGERTRPVK
jgi:hypothetical protein